MVVTGVDEKLCYDGVYDGVCDGVYANERWE